MTAEQQIKVGMDFDHTYTLDPVMWDKIILDMLANGWDVRIVTFRFDNPSVNGDIIEACERLGIPAIYTGGNQKQPHCERQHQFVPSFWIDDMPALIPSAMSLLEMATGCVRTGDISGKGMQA